MVESRLLEQNCLYKQISGTHYISNKRILCYVCVMYIVHKLKFDFLYLWRNKLCVSQLSVHVSFLSFPWIIESKLHSKSGEVLEVAAEDTVGEEANFSPCYTCDFTLFESAQHELL